MLSNEGTVQAPICPISFSPLLSASRLSPQPPPLDRGESNTSQIVQKSGSLCCWIMWATYGACGRIPTLPPPPSSTLIGPSANSNPTPNRNRNRNPKILWLQYRWTWLAAVLVIVSILAWFATACVLTTLTVDFDFFMVRGDRADDIGNRSDMSRENNKKSVVCSLVPRRRLARKILCWTTFFSAYVSSS